MLEIRNLTVAVAKDPDNIILNGMNLSIPDGEVHVLFGPNGSGKSTLLKTIMGFPTYKVVDGSIIFKGVDITDFSITKRAEMGIGMSFQRPPNIPGLKLSKIAEYLLDKKGETTATLGILAKELRLRDFLNRELNVNFSGGEIKRSELLQLMLQDPDLVLLDEPESGVDIDAMKLIGKMTNKLLGNGSFHRRKKNKSALVITHTGHILDYIHVDKGHIACHGHIGCSGTPSRLLDDIKNYGYPPCSQCLADQSNNQKNFFEI